MNFSIPKIELEDGSMVDILDVSFANGADKIPKSVLRDDSDDDEACSLACKISFKSARPVSFSTEIVFFVGHME